MFNIELQVMMVELIINTMLQRQYEKAKEEFGDNKKSVEERLVFHGSSKETIEKIIEEGFKLDDKGMEAWNGSGVYMTTVDPNGSILCSKVGSMMLLSSALLGEKGKDYISGQSLDVLVLRKAEYLLPKYIIHFAKK